MKKTSLFLALVLLLSSFLVACSNGNGENKAANNEQANNASEEPAKEAGKDFDESVVNLASDLRKIGVKNISKKTKMSPNVNDFYKKISSYGLFEENLARGLVATGVIFH